MSVLIGIGHKKRRGKDTVAKRLVDKHGFRLISWADGIKDSSRIIFGWNNDQLYGELKEVIDPYWGFSPRWAMQKFGVEACRNNIDEDIWIKSAWLRIEAIWRTTPNVGIVIPDVRFENEASFIRKKGGKLWRVDRALEENETSSHSSETALNNFQEWDEVLDNNSTLTHLYALTDSAFERTAKPPTGKRNALNRRTV